MVQRRRHPHLTKLALLGSHTSLHLACIVSICFAWSVTTSAEQGPAAADRFRMGSHIGDVDAQWVSRGNGILAFGSGGRITIMDSGQPSRPKMILDAEGRILDGIVTGDHLYAIQQLDGRQQVLRWDLTRVGAEPISMQLSPAPRAALHLGRMDDYLLLTEDGFGLRILELPSHRHASSTSHSVLPMVGFFPLEEPMTAVTASMRVIYVATESSLVVLRADPPTVPGLLFRVPLVSDVHALAANGPTVYLLGSEGLRLLDLSGKGVSRTPRAYPGVRGRSVYLAGRKIYLAAGNEGLMTFTDTKAVAATVFIDVGDIFFDPDGLVEVEVGDTVTWQKGLTNLQHNVSSSSGAEGGFSSGSPTTGFFIFSVTFTQEGSNPYRCEVHASMNGDITAATSATPPPAVPTQEVGKLSPTGSELSIDYDVTTCAPDNIDHAILYGTQFPAALGDPYMLAGSRCNLGASSPFLWSDPPTARGVLWWVIVATDGNATEGSWGKDSLGGERDSGLGGPSNECGSTVKSLANVCGQ